MSTQRPVYLDNVATTAVDPEVLEAMMPYFQEQYGNPASSVHRFGWEAQDAVAAARRQVAAVAGADPDDVLFTGSATEANNLALRGAASVHPGGKEILTVATEHKAVLEPCAALALEGHRVVTLPVDRQGDLDLEVLAEALTDRVALVSVMLGNNEIGTLHPLGEIGSLVAGRPALLHCDASQAFGKVRVDLDEMGIDLLSVSAHKLHGPKGVGALCLRRSEKLPAPEALTALLVGGGQERGLRPGTLNVPGIVGLGRAAEIAGRGLPGDAVRISALRDRLERVLETELDGVVFRGRDSRAGRLPHVTSVTFEAVHSEALLVATDRVAFSAGSACTTEQQEPSHVLRAIGLSREEAISTVRFGLSRFTTEEEVRVAAGEVVRAVKRLRAVGGVGGG